MLILRQIRAPGRRLQPPRLRGGAGGREDDDRDRLPRAGCGLLPAPRDQGRAPADDNGSAYVSALHALACRRLGIRHSRTRPYRPQTNGKAERFIRTLVAGWAHGVIYRTPGTLGSP